MLFVYILIPLLTVNKRENVSIVCSGAAVLSAVKLKVFKQKNLSADPDI